MVGLVQRPFQVSQNSVDTFSGKVESVYIILQQIYSGNCILNFTRIARVLWKILQETFWSLFPGHTVSL